MKFQQFLEFCKSCSSTDVIYDTYYDDRALTEAIYAEARRLGVDLHATPEPMRASLIAIGSQYGIQVLIDW